jgi:hypothetical protein
VDIARQRLRNQKLIRTDLDQPERVVSWLGAVQAQDYPAAKWALGLRAKGITDADVEAAFNEGRILRTHILRPTWHFVVPADIRWMLALTGPRVNARMAPYYRQHELNERTFARAMGTFQTALQGGNHLTRLELASALQKDRIAARAQRLAALVLRAELDGVICSGPRRGKQFTYALLNERVPRTPNITREEALARLTMRYFTSHGPAALHDYVWWSGLTVGDAKAGIEMAKRTLLSEDIDGRPYWFAERVRVRLDERSLHLLPNYDEYLIAYKHRDSAMDRTRSARIAVRDEFAHQLVIGGKLRGSWRRSHSASAATVEVRSFVRLTQDEARGVAAEVARYGRFFNVPVTATTRQV